MKIGGVMNRQKSGEHYNLNQISSENVSQNVSSLCQTLTEYWSFMICTLLDFANVDLTNANCVAMEKLANDLPNETRV